MGIGDYRQRMLSGERQVGTFVKMPSVEVIETLAASGLDFICLDAEHAPIDRARMDACLALSRALDFPVLVRVPAATPEHILNALDSGAVGVVCPHVASVEKAAEIAKWAHFGKGGRGFAGATRWAGYGRQAMADVLAQSRRETVVIAQIEEPEGVEAADAIAATDGIDGLFIGPADLSVSLGKTALGSDELWAAFEAVGHATRAHGKAFVSFAVTPKAAEPFLRYGVTVFYIGSDLGFVASGAKTAAEATQTLG